MRAAVELSLWTALESLSENMLHLLIPPLCALHTKKRPVATGGTVMGALSRALKRMSETERL